MKRLLFLFLISFTLTSTRSFANDIDITAPVLQSFNSSFKNATEVNWSMVDDYYKVNFIFNDQSIAAFYDRGGSLMAITRHILSTQLPFSLQSNLKNDYEDYWISDLFELNNDQGTFYFATVEKADVKIILKSNLSGGWSLYKKINK